jgi:hypothetical protein
LNIVTTSANIYAGDVFTILTKDNTYLYVVISNTNSNSSALIKKIKKSDMSVVATSATIDRDQDGRSFEDNSYVYVFTSSGDYYAVNKTNLTIGSNSLSGGTYFAVTDKYVYTNYYITDKSNVPNFDYTKLKPNHHRVGELICGDVDKLFWFQENGKFGGGDRSTEYLSGRIVITDEITSKVVYATSTILRPSTCSFNSMFTYDDNNLYVFDLKTHAIIKFTKNDHVIKNIIGYHKE